VLKYSVQFRYRGTPTLTGTSVQAKDFFDAITKVKMFIKREGMMLPCDELVVKLIRETEVVEKSCRTFTAENSYVSQNVFDSKRSLTASHVAYLREIADQHSRRPSRNDR
jgi:hypothetical protein